MYCMGKTPIKINWTLQGWIARDEELMLFREKPNKGTHKWFGYPICKLPDDMFPELTWDSEPIEVDITFKKK